MAFPQGIDFRATSGFVTDPANDYGEISATANYPTTTPQGNTVGWEQAPDGTADRSSSIDARLAGLHFRDNASAVVKYRLDLPSSGSYVVTLASGEPSFAHSTKVELFDGTTSLGVLCSGDVTSGQWFDATDVVRTSAADWVSNNATVTKTFSGTIARFAVGGATTVADHNSVIAHIFLQSAASGFTAKFRRTLSQVGTRVGSRQAQAA